MASKSKVIATISTTGAFVIWVAMLGSMGAWWYLSPEGYQRIRQLDETLHACALQREHLQKTLNDLTYQLDQWRTDPEYIQAYIRQHLHLVFPEEKVYVSKSKNRQTP